MRIAIIVTLLAFVLTPVQAQDDVAPISSVAQVTTYTAAVGDKLLYEFPVRNQEVTATIANIDTRVGAVTVTMEIWDRSKPRHRSNLQLRRMEWIPSVDFIKNNFFGFTTRREVLRVGNFNVAVIRVDADNKSFWFRVDSQGTSRYPELIRAVAGNRVLVNLRSITRPNRKK